MSSLSSQTTLTSYCLFLYTYPTWSVDSFMQLNLYNLVTRFFLRICSFYVENHALRPSWLDALLKSLFGKVVPWVISRVTWACTNFHLNFEAKNEHGVLFQQQFKTQPWKECLHDFRLRGKNDFYGEQNSWFPNYCSFHRIRWWLKTNYILNTSHFEKRREYFSEWAGMAVSY